MPVKINRNKIKFRVIFFLYILVAFLVLRKFLFQPGTLGHNWDWSIPYLKNQLIYMAQNSFFIWREVIFGFFNPLVINLSPFSFMWGSLAYLGANGDFVSKFLPFVSIVIAGISMYYLLVDFLKISSNRGNFKIIFYSALFGSLFYALSPYLFNDIIGGAATQFFTYAFFPLALYFLRKFEYSSRFIHIFFLVIILTIIGFSFQRLFLIFVILLTYPIFSEKFLPVYKNLLKSFILFICLNFYWILFILMGGWREGLAFGKEYLLLSTLKNNVPSIAEAFIGLGYFRDFFKYSINPNILIFWYILSYGLLVIAIFSIIIFKQIRQRDIFFWISLFLVSLIFSTGGKPPLGNLVLWMYRNFPFMLLFKGPQHLLILSTFSLAVLLGFGFFSFVSKLSEKKLPFSILIVLFLFIFLTIWIFPFLTGNLGLDYLSYKGGGNFVDTYKLSPEYKKIFEKTFRELKDFRILPLPMTHSPYYLKTEYQNEGQGGDPFLIYSKKPFILTDIPNSERKFTRIIEKLFYTQSSSPNISKFLGLSNVKYVILRKDVRPIFGPFASIWNYSQINENLKKLKGFWLVNKYKYISLWKSRDFLPHIFSSTTPTIIGSNIEALVPVTETKYLDGKPVIVFTEQNQKSNIKNQKLTDINNFVFKDSDYRDLAIELVRGLKLEVNHKQQKFKIEKPGIYEFWLDKSELEEIPEVEIRIDEKEMVKQYGVYSMKYKGRRYLKIGEVELEEGKHVIGVHSSSFIVDSKNKVQDLKLILVSKEEREKLEEEICKKIEKPETEVAYILSKDGEFYVP